MGSWMTVEVMCRWGGMGSSIIMINKKKRAWVSRISQSVNNSAKFSPLPLSLSSPPLCHSLPRSRSLLSLAAFCRKEPINGMPGNILK